MCSTANSESPYSSIFGPLVAVARVLDRELVQVELLLHLRELGVGRVLAAPPRRSSPGRFRYSLISAGSMSASLRPSW